MAKAYKCDECGRLLSGAPRPFYCKLLKFYNYYGVSVEVSHTGPPPETGSLLEGVEIRNWEDSQLCPPCRVRILEAMLKSFKLDLENQEVENGQSI